jgi:hypothetical protein
MDAFTIPVRAPGAGAAARAHRAEEDVLPERKFTRHICGGVGLEDQDVGTAVGDGVHEGKWDREPAVHARAPGDHHRTVVEDGNREGSVQHGVRGLLREVRVDDEALTGRAVEQGDILYSAL